MKQKQKDGERKRERARGIEEKAGRRGKRLRSEKHVCPRKREREMQPGASVKLWPNRVRWQSVRERRTVGSLPAQKFRDAQGLANRCAHVRR